MTIVIPKMRDQCPNHQIVHSEGVWRKGQSSPCSIVVARRDVPEEVLVESPSLNEGI